MNAMNFDEVKYERPDFDTYAQQLKQAANELTNADNAQAAVAIAKATVPAVNAAMSAAMLATIRHSIDTRDAYYTAEDEYWNEFGPQYDNVETDYLKALVNSPYREALETVYPKPFFLKAENQLRIQTPAVLELQQRDNQLISEYDNLTAGAQIDFQGKTYTLAQLGGPMADADRQTRKAASAAYWGWYADHEAQIDQIYDQMVQVRTEIAHTLGFKDYSEMSYVFMDRFGYDEAQVAKYRQAIQTQVVPKVVAQRQKQAKRLGLAKLDYFDLGVQFKTGNAKPVGTPIELVAKANHMYHQMAPVAGEFFQHMIDSHLLDLVAKPGKAGGGYAEYIPSIESPFIFSNFNGTSGDVDVLTHEAGHALQTYVARWIQPGDTVFPTNEAAEIFSMSMEFIAYPYMPAFFEGQTDKYLYAHLQAALEFLPYGILVDHFQHEVYTHPTWTPAERKAAWRDLEKQYCPDRDYAENPALNRGIYWFRQAHIFDVPFYYLDYTIAQVVAFEFWQRFNVEHDPKAWEDYMAMAKAGGSQTLMALIQTGHLRSPFEPATLKDTLDAVQQALDAVDDVQLDHH